MQISFTITNPTEFGNSKETVKGKIDPDFIKRETGLDFEQTPLSIKAKMEILQAKCFKAEKVFETASNNLSNAQIEKERIALMKFNEAKNPVKSTFKKVAIIALAILAGLALGAITGGIALPALVFIGHVGTLIFCMPLWFSHGFGLIFAEPILYKIGLVAGMSLGALAGGYFGASEAHHRCFPRSPNIEALEKKKQHAQEQYEDAARQVSNCQKDYENCVGLLPTIQQRLNESMISYEEKLSARYDESNLAIKEAMEQAKKQWKLNCETIDTTVKIFEKIKIWTQQQPISVS